LPTAAGITSAGTSASPSAEPVSGPPPDQTVDLSRLAYMRDGDLWIMDLPSGTPQRLTNSGDVHDRPGPRSGIFLVRVLWACGMG
jgi:hypothetical protein